MSRQMMIARYAMLLALAGACSPGDSLSCESSERAVGIETNTAAGSPESVLDLILGSEDHTLRGPTVGESTLHLDVSWKGEDAAWADRTPSYESADPAADGASDGEPVCSDALVVPVELAFSTSDGRFDEAWSVEGSASQPGLVVLDHEVPSSALRGDWRPQVQGYDSIRLRVHIEWTEDGSAGVLTAVASPDDGGPDESWDVAVWPG